MMIANMSKVQVVYRLPITDVVSIDQMPSKCHPSLSLRAKFCEECGKPSPLQTDPNRSLKSGFTGTGSIVIQGRNRFVGGAVKLGFPTSVVVNGWSIDIPHDLRFDDKYDCRLANDKIEIIVAEGASNIKQALIHTESFHQSLADNGIHFNYDDLIVLDSTLQVSGNLWMDNRLLC